MIKFDISVIIPTNRKSVRLHEVVESIISTSYGSKVIVQIIVVDNSSFSESLNIHPKEDSAFVNISIIKSKSGANFARNEGLEYSQSEILLFIDDDCIIEDPDFLKKHLDFHNNNVNALACGGFYRADPSVSSLDQYYIEGQNNWLLRGIVNQNLKINYLLGGNVSFKKKILNQHNLKFDENIKYGGSETEFFVRIKNLELECFLIDAVVNHHCNLTVLELCKKSYKQGRGKKYREKKHSFEIANSIYVSTPQFKNRHMLYAALQSLWFRIGYNSIK